MAKISLKSSCKISRRMPSARPWSAARVARPDLETWIRRQGGVSCPNRKTMDSAAESLLLYGTVQSAARHLRQVEKRLDVLQRRFRILHKKFLPAQP
jgi:hypothetical protein